MVVHVIYLGADHAGFRLKEKIKGFLEKKGLKYIDVGAENIKPADDYPDYAKKVAGKVQKGGRGILVCGTGTGMAIAANRFRGVRAAPCYNKKTAYLSRMHNNSNILCLGAREIKAKEAIDVCGVWLKTGFESAVRHRRRIKKIDAR